MTTKAVAALKTRPIVYEKSQQLAGLTNCRPSAVCGSKTNRQGLFFPLSSKRAENINLACTFIEREAKKIM